MKRAIAIGLLSTLASASMAQSLFYDDFESETQTGNRQNYNSFVNWDVTDGTVDLWTGFGGNGQIVDLDGSSSNAGIFSTKQDFSLAAGQLYRVSWRMLGNMRTNTPDSVNVKFGGVEQNYVVNRNDPWTDFSFDVTPLSAMNSKLIFENGGGDNFGAWIDEVEIEAVPEPGTLALLAIGGMALLRRRRA